MYICEDACMSTCDCGQCVLTLQYSLAYVHMAILYYIIVFATCTVYIHQPCQKSNACGQAGSMCCAARVSHSKSLSMAISAAIRIP